MAYRVYVIRNRERKFYIGLSDDVARRVQQHNAGQSQWTKGHGPWTIVWQSEESSLTDARKLENRLKRQGRGKGSMPLRVCIEAAHNPAVAGSLVQIQPPQPNFLAARGPVRKVQRRSIERTRSRVAQW